DLARSRRRGRASRARARAARARPSAPRLRPGRDARRDAVGRDGTDDRGPAAGVLAPRARDAGPGSALGDRLAVDVDRPLRRALPREEGLDARAPRLAHRTPAL